MPFLPTHPAAPCQCGHDRGGHAFTHAFTEAEERYRDGRCLRSSMDWSSPDMCSCEKFKLAKKEFLATAVGRLFTGKDKD